MKHLQENQNNITSMIQYLLKTLTIFFYI